MSQCKMLPFSTFIRIRIFQITKTASAKKGFDVAVADLKEKEKKICSYYKKCSLIERKKTEMFSSVEKPNIPMSGDFLIDTRKNGYRIAINSTWKSRNDKHLIRIEIINEKDLQLIGHFYNYNNYVNLINVNPEETEKFAFDAVKKCLSQPFSFVAFDGEKLVGIKLNRIHTPSEFQDLFDGLHESNPKFIIKNDYANELQSAPYTFEANKIYVNLEECFRQTGKFLPKDVKNLGVLKATGIHPDYRGTGLIQYLYAESLKVFEKNGCNYFIGYCVSEKTYKMCQNYGMKEIFNFPFSSFKANGKQLFELKNGEEPSCCFAMMGNVQDGLKIAKQIEANH